MRTKGCVLLQSTPPLAIHGHGKKFEVQFKVFKKSLDDKTTIFCTWLGTNKVSMRNKQMTENLVLFMPKLRVPLGQPELDLKDELTVNDDRGLCRWVVTV